MRRRNHIRTIISVTALAAAACSGHPATPTPTPTPPSPPTAGATATAYILPGARGQKNFAFGDEPVVIYTGERMRWVNLDAETHDVTADTAALPEFAGTGPLTPGGEQSVIMHTIGTTTIHCSIHPEMVGTLIVRDR